MKDSPLGKKVKYISTYSPDLLFPIPRESKRKEIGINDKLPFKGCDIWNSFELSWLNNKGKPVVAFAEFIIPADSPNIIESKSFKLYLNSFNNTHFASVTEAEKRLHSDLSKAAGKEITVKADLIKNQTPTLQCFDDLCLDDYDISCDTYHVDSNYLTTNDEFITEKLYSNLLKSNCPITGQPDWASIQICYTGIKINHTGLLKYIVSFRDHDEFHEQCIERMFCDIMKRCQPQSLSIYARYTRRGGLDINPYRSTDNECVENIRLFRQ